LVQTMPVGPCIPEGKQLQRADGGPTSGSTWRLSHHCIPYVRKGSECQVSKSVNSDTCPRPTTTPCGRSRRGAAGSLACARARPRPPPPTMRLEFSAPFLESLDAKNADLFRESGPENSKRMVNGHRCFIKFARLVTGNISRCPVSLLWSGVPRV
jgi:hypothetical protein